MKSKTAPVTWLFTGVIIFLLACNTENDQAPYLTEIAQGL